jgi:hypothetical protein
MTLGAISLPELQLDPILRLLSPFTVVLDNLHQPVKDGRPLFAPSDNKLLLKASRFLPQYLSGISTRLISS